MSNEKVSRFPKIKIYSKAPGALSTGMNTVVEVDGKKLPITDVKIHFNAKKVTKVQMELFVGEVDLEIDADVEVTEVKS